MTIFRNRLFMASSLGHLILDIFNSAGPVLVAFLSVSMGLDNKSVALAIGLYQFTGAFSQPVFGWLADRHGGRGMMGLSIAWTIGFLVLAIFTAQSGLFWWFLIPFALASFGSGAFHPVGTKFAALTVTKRAATATALFFLFGQSGLAIGPILAGAILEHVGLIGLPILAIFTIPVILFVLATPVPAVNAQDAQNAQMNALAPTEPPTSKEVEIASPPAKGGQAEKSWSLNGGNIPWGSILILIVHTIFRSWAQIGVTYFVPKLFQDKGWEPTAYGAIVSVMWVASAVAGVLAGNAADRWGRRQVVFIAMILSIVPLYLLPITDTAFVFVLAFLVGGLTGAPHSIIVVIAQTMLPGKQATASGLILGLIFGMGAFATFAIGWLADLWTLESALQLGAGMALLAALTALMLPGTRQTPETRLAVETKEMTL